MHLPRRFFVPAKYKQARCWLQANERAGTGSVWSCSGEFIRQPTDHVVACRSDRDRFRGLYVKLRPYPPKGAILFFTGREAGEK